MALTGPIEQLVVDQLVRRSREAAWGNFEELWPTLPPAEQVRVV